jgi:cardiolipin synthase
MSTWFIVVITAAVTALAKLVIDFMVHQFARCERRVEHKIEHLYTVSDELFGRPMANLLTGPLMYGNKIESLLNGDEIFPAMLEAIRSVSRTITFETFIYWAGDIGREFAQALADRGRAGVKVHLMLDWFGSKEIDLQAMRLMEDAGVEVECYHKIRYFRFRKINHRTHRKLLIIDRRVSLPVASVSPMNEPATPQALITGATHIIMSRGHGGLAVCRHGQLD